MGRRLLRVRRSQGGSYGSGWGVHSWGPWMLAWSESPWPSEAGAGLCPYLVSLPSVLSSFHKKTQWPSVWTRPWGPRGDSGMSAGACLECEGAWNTSEAGAWRWVRPGFHCQVWGGDLHSTQGCVRKETLSCKVGTSSLEGAGVALGCSGECRPA